VSGYDRALVEHLLHAVWDEGAAWGIKNPYEPDPSMPRVKLDPTCGGTLFAYLADIRSAWREADIPQVERQALLLRHGFDWLDREIAFCQGVSRNGARRRVERGVGRLVAHLNGKAYQDVEDGDGPVLTE
jgi:hypothetical protein